MPTIQPAVAPFWKVGRDTRRAYNVKIVLDSTTTRGSEQRRRVSRGARAGGRQNVVKYMPCARLLRAFSAVDVTVVLGHHDKYPNESAFVAALKRRNPRIEVVINSSIQVRLFGRPLIVAYDHMHGIYQEGNAHLDVNS